MTYNPPLKCVCEHPDIVETICAGCGLPIHPTTEPKYCEMSGQYGKDNDKNLHFYCEFCGVEMDYDQKNRKCPAPLVAEGEWGLDPANCKAGDKHTGIFNAITHAQMATTKEEMQTSRIEVFQEMKSFITSLIHDERERSYKQGNLEAINGTYERQEVIQAEERERIVKMCEEMIQECEQVKDMTIEKAIYRASALSDLRDKLTTYND